MKHKKTLRMLALCMAVLLMALTLTACGPSEEEVVGGYGGSYEYKGNLFAVGIVLTAEGRYAKTTLKNGENNGSEMGDWELKGSKVICYPDDSLTYHGTSITYKWKNGQLENNDHYFTKVDLD
ncbi:MAG: hypothetical protein IJC68_03785 [Firmicutes bacterium]|nr:hypothetical protein [Bacillota bacterium]